METPLLPHKGTRYCQEFCAINSKFVGYSARTETLDLHDIVIKDWFPESIALILCETIKKVLSVHVWTYC